MEIIGVSSSSGSLGKNLGTEVAPEKIIKKLNIPKFIITGGNIQDIGDNLYKYVKKSRSKLFLIGGDHSISYFSIKAFSEKYDDIGLLVFDAHPDMQGSDFVTHEDYLRILIEQKFIKPQNIVLVGIRSISNEELEYLKNKKIIYFNMDKILDLGIKEVCDLIMEKFVSFNMFYLSIDIDVVDPAFAPGTGYLEPGGISSSDLLYLLNRIKNMKNLIAVDLVEINPNKDQNEITLNLGCKVVEVFK